MREFFQTGTTMPLHYRRSILVKLRSYLKKHEEEALQALTDDLGKSSFEGYATELGIVYDEIRFCLSKMYGWAKPKRVPTPLASFSFILENLCLALRRSRRAFAMELPSSACVSSRSTP